MHPSIPKSLFTLYTSIWDTLYNKLEYYIFIKMIFCSCCRQTGLVICPEMGILLVLTHFASGTSIHGLTFIVQKRLPIWERVTWTLVFIAAMIYATERLHVAIVGKNGKFDFLIRDWFPKFANGLNIIIGIVQIVYEWSSCPFAKIIPPRENHFGKRATWSLKRFLNYACYDI